MTNFNGFVTFYRIFIYAKSFVLIFIYSCTRSYGKTYFARLTVYTGIKVSVYKQIAKESYRLKQNSCICVYLKITDIFFKVSHLGYWLFGNESTVQLHYSGHNRDLKTVPVIENCPLLRVSSQIGLFCFKKLLLGVRVFYLFVCLFIYIFIYLFFV